ncbi:MAG: glycosyltransferase family 2 protein [Solirubrobacteraceae bacterium]|jgi:GT2 family glycosyltransferase
MDTPSISVVVVAYRQREALAACLDACVAAGAAVPGEIELIVVDNGGLASFVRAQCPSAALLEPGDNIGFAGGVQLGIEAARGRWIALVNDDARLEPSALATLLAAGERDAQTGAVAAQVRFEAHPETINSAGIEVDVLGVANERFAGQPLELAGGDGGFVFGASACVALYRAEMLRQIGGFDRRFFAYLEDVDVAWRARAAGWQAWYEPRAVAYHSASASTGAASPQKYFLAGRNRVSLLARNATRRQLLRALPGIVLYDSAYVVYVAAADRTLAPLWGRLLGLRQWRRLRHEMASRRREVALAPALAGARAAWKMQRAYRRAAGSRGG